MDSKASKNESVLITHGICYFCKQRLWQTDQMHSATEYIYKCDNCHPKTEHIFYTVGRLHLTLRTKLWVKEKEYLLYLYPTNKYQVLLQYWPDDRRPIDLLKMDSMQGFTGNNLQSKVERILNLKAFL